MRFAEWTLRLGPSSKAAIEWRLEAPIDVKECPADYTIKPGQTSRLFLNLAEIFLLVAPDAHHVSLGTLKVFGSDDILLRLAFSGVALSILFNYGLAEVLELVESVELDLIGHVGASIASKLHGNSIFHFGPRHRAIVVVVATTSASASATSSSTSSSRLLIAPLLLGFQELFPVLVDSTLIEVFGTILKHVVRIQTIVASGKRSCTGWFPAAVHESRLLGGGSFVPLTCLLHVSEGIPGSINNFLQYLYEIPQSWLASRARRRFH